MKKLLSIIFCLSSLVPISAQSIQEFILKDTNKAVIPSSVIQTVKGQWDWTNGVDSLSLYFIDNEYFDFRSKFGSPDLCALIGYWYYSRYKSVKMGSKFALYDKDWLKKDPGNLLDLFLGNIWEPRKRMMTLDVTLGISKSPAFNNRLHMNLQLIDNNTMLLLFDGHVGEGWLVPKPDDFHEFLLPSNIVLKKKAVK